MKNRSLCVSIIINLVLVITTLIFIVLFCRSCNKPIPNPIIITDTITVTEFKDSIKYITQYDTIVTNNIDTIYNGDTIKLTDTIKVNLPIEHKESSFNITKDSINLNCNIEYSGFKAKIDTVYFDYEYKLPQQKQNKWSVGWTFSIGPSVGYGIVFKPDGTYTSGPYIGINGTIGIGITKKFTRSK